MNRLTTFFASTVDRYLKMFAVRPSQASIDARAAADAAHKAYLNALLAQAKTPDKKRQVSYMTPFLEQKQKRGRGYRMPDINFHR